MDKVINFFEKYAEWLAMGVAGAFLLFMVWSYVVNPTELEVEVAGQKVLPGSVEPTVNVAARQLQQKFEGGGKIEPPSVPNFAEQFARSMDANRPRGPIEIANMNPPPPSPQRHVVAGDTRLVGAQQPGVANKIVKVLPVPPPAQFVASLTGQSYVVDPTNPANQWAFQQQGGLNNQNAQLAAGVDKTWVTVEFKVDTIALANAWKVAFPQPQMVPPQAMETYFLRCQVEREELLSPGKWGNPTIVKPLPLEEIPDMPKPLDKVAEHTYDAWAREHQVTIAEPAFYPIMEGDLKEGWAPPSIVELRAAARDQANVQQVMQTFDPATYTGPLDVLTDAQKRQVYMARQQQKQEQQRQAAAERKSRAAAAEAQRNSRSGGGGYGSGGRGGRYGGDNAGGPGVNYAPMPEGVIIAQAQGPRSALIEEEMGIRPRNPQQGRYANVPQAPQAARPAPVQFDPNIQLQGGIPNGPFNPMILAGQGLAGQPGQPPMPVAPGQAPQVMNLVVWAHDDNVVPGKTYRYRMKVYFRNPVWAVTGLSADPKFEEQFALEPADVNNNKGWSDWSKDVRVPHNTQYFFANAKHNFQAGVVTNAVVDVFKRDKGKWVKGQFVVAPGDSIGQPQNGVDFATGETLVDLRSELRRDVRIITADASGELRTAPLTQYQADPQYQQLLKELKMLAEQAATGTDGAVIPATYNPNPYPTGTPQRGPTPGPVGPPIRRPRD